MVVVGVTATVAACGLLAAWLLVPVLWVSLDEAAIPPASEIPDGITVVSDEKGCGSGGCWRELRVRPRESQSADELAAALGLERERCTARSWLDRRRVCTGGNVVGDEVRMYQQYDRIPGL